MDYDAFNRAITQAIFIKQLRDWIAQGGLATIIAKLDYLERSETRDVQRLTPAMRDEIAATGTLGQPWLESCAGLERLLIAERVEAAAKAGVLPVW